MTTQHLLRGNKKPYREEIKLLKLRSGIDQLLGHPSLLERKPTGADQ